MKNAGTLSDDAIIAPVFTSALRAAREARKDAAARLAQIGKRIRDTQQTRAKLAREREQIETPARSEDRLEQLLAGSASDPTEKEVRTRAESLVRLDVLLREHDRDIVLLVDAESRTQGEARAGDTAVRLAELACLRALQARLIERYESLARRLVSEIVHPLRAIDGHLQRLGSNRDETSFIQALLGLLRIPARHEGDAVVVGFNTGVTLWVNNGHVAPGNLPSDLKAVMFDQDVSEFIAQWQSPLCATSNNGEVESG